MPRGMLFSILQIDNLNFLAIAAGFVAIIFGFILSDDQGFPIITIIIIGVASFFVGIAGLFISLFSGRY